MPFIAPLLQFKNPVFVETGTYLGETTAFVHQHGFDRIFTIELSGVYYQRAALKFINNPGVTVFHGNSKTDLWNLISHIPHPMTFWLDSHWSGVPDVGCDPVTLCPILEELEQISRHPIKTHTIMVDDMRLMDGVHFPVVAAQIIEALRKINPAYSLAGFDDALATNDVLVAYAG